MYTLVYLEEERALCVKHEDTWHSEPTRQVLYWPIWKGGSKSNAELYALGAELRREDSGAYVYRGLDMPRVRFVLDGGGQAQAIKVETEAIAPPKVRAGVEVRWHQGYWQKYLKAKGWVAA